MPRDRFVTPMSTLRELAAAHAPLLLIDAASSRVQVGWWGKQSRDAAWATSDDEASVAIFRCVEKLGVNLDEVGAFVFCEGPGSVLGIRSVAMAVRTWCAVKPRPVFAYASLAIVAHTMGRAEVSVIADARRESWHLYQIGRGLRRVALQELSGEMVMPENFRAWSEVPPNVTRVPYSLADRLPRVLDADVFHATEAPDAFLHEEPSYVTWTPQIHRAPGERPMG
jgi:tRNA threonylcarbamoyladenosine biosynthesis protein TsaB